MQQEPNKYKSEKGANDADLGGGGAEYEKEQPIDLSEGVNEAVGTFALALALAVSLFWAMESMGPPFPKIQEQTWIGFRRTTVDVPENLDTGLSALDYLSVRADGVLQCGVVWQGNAMYKQWLDLTCAQWGLESALTDADVQKLAMPDLID